jgi:hypothetical protein
MTVRTIKLPISMRTAVSCSRGRGPAGPGGPADSTLHPISPRLQPCAEERR